jgi:hypothetical protein
MTEFYYDADRDTYDGCPWTETDIDDLRSSAESGSTFKEAATFLCRSGSVEDVAKKAAELGLHFGSRERGDS